MRAIILLAIICTFTATTLAQGTLFTYQGRLTDGGSAANGTYEMQFKLTDLAGVQIGSPITHSAVTVTDGVFTVLLNYGPAFTGADRLLEISVRPAGSGNPFTLLSPRQPITSVPYAYRAAVTSTADTATNATQLGGVGANQYVLTSDSRLTDARLPLAGSNAYIQNGGGLQNAGFVIAGDGFAMGTLQGNVVKASNSYFLGIDRFISVGGSLKSSTYIGREAGNSADPIASENNTFIGFLSGKNTVNKSLNTFVGAFSGLENKGENNSFFGNAAGQNTTTGTQNSFFGAEAGHFSLGGNNNSTFGYEAGLNVKGDGNAFFGASTGRATGNGTNNSFFGREAGETNTSGSSNTIVGALADVSSTGLSFATAIGASATVGTSNTIVLGRSNGSDGVRVPGTLTLSTLGTVGLTSVCRNALNQLSVCSSSLRYKTNLAPFSGGLALLNRLKPITFNWKSDDSADLGFGAEDVAAVEPLLAIRNEQGQVEGVKYDRISAVLVNAVKEQQEQIAAQQLLLQKQNKKIERLEQLLCRRNQSACR
jgi:hypothetical protein